VHGTLSSVRRRDAHVDVGAMPIVAESRSLQARRADLRFAFANPLRALCCR
jgi:hypothetical protein